MGKEPPTLASIASTLLRSVSKLFKPSYMHGIALIALILAATFVSRDPPPVLLKSHDIDAIRSVIADEIPHFKIDSLVMLATDGDHVVAEVNGNWIFRFPRLDTFLPVIARESLLMRSLQSKISLDIPFYEYRGKRVAFVAYRKIMGDPLDEKCYLSLSMEDRQKTAECVADFLMEFHTAVAAHEALAWGYQPYSISYPFLEEHLSSIPSVPMRRMIREALTYAETYEPKDLVIIHNDLHGENFSFNIPSRQLVGVIDFSDAVVADYSIEFAKLFTIHADLASRVSEAYAKKRAMPNPLRPAAADYILRKATSFIKARQSRDISRIVKLRETLQSFIPIWDTL
jgi:aminoglycoside phosphotransferase (APT) family kinase protein